MDRAGNRRHLVQVQKRSDDEDSFGGQLTTWATLFSTKVGIEALSGRELMAAQAVQSEVTHQISAVYRPEWANPKTSASYRIVLGSRIFNIHSALNVDERNRELLILASEGLNDG
jgi:SPP1 family predicted phage head-tail adaptor